MSPAASSRRPRRPACRSTSCRSPPCRRSSRASPRRCSACSRSSTRSQAARAYGGTAPENVRARGQQVAETAGKKQSGKARRQVVLRHLALPHSRSVVCVVDGDRWGQLWPDRFAWPARCALCLALPPSLAAWRVDLELCRLRPARAGSIAPPGRSRRQRRSASAARHARSIAEDRHRSDGNPSRRRASDIAPRLAAQTRFAFEVPRRSIPLADR